MIRRMLRRTIAWYSALGSEKGLTTFEWVSLFALTLGMIVFIMAAVQVGLPEMGRIARSGFEQQIAAWEEGSSPEVLYGSGRGPEVGAEATVGVERAGEGFDPGRLLSGVVEGISTWVHERWDQVQRDWSGLLEWWHSIPDWAKGGAIAVAIILLVVVVVIAFLLAVEAAALLLILAFIGGILGMLAAALAAIWCGLTDAGGCDFWESFLRSLGLGLVVAALPLAIYYGWPILLGFLQVTWGWLRGVAWPFLRGLLERAWGWVKEAVWPWIHRQLVLIGRRIAENWESLVGQNLGYILAKLFLLSFGFDQPPNSGDILVDLLFLNVGVLVMPPALKQLGSWGSGVWSSATTAVRQMIKETQLKGPDPRSWNWGEIIGRSLLAFGSRTFVGAGDPGVGRSFADRVIRVLFPAIADDILRILNQPAPVPIELLDGRERGGG